MSEFDLFVEGRPLAQQRPRTYSAYGKTRTVSLTGANRAWQNKVRSEIRAEWLERGNPSPMCEVEAEIVFLLPIADKRRHLQPHTARPDIDNLVKLVMDAMQPEKGDTLWKGAVADDGTIYDLRTKKFYTNDKPGVRIRLSGHPKDC